VATEVKTGYQWLAGLWERPYGRTIWQVPVDEVDAVVRSLFDRYTVWRMYADPFRWETGVAAWEGAYPERVIQWPTNRVRQMAHAIAGFDAAIKEHVLSHDGSPDYTRHIGNARRDDKDRMVDEQGKPLYIIRKERPDSPHKIDAAMAGILSWKARTDAIAAGATEEPQFQAFFVGGR
jgi:phage terminase large subunit-like protein